MSTVVQLRQGSAEWLAYRRGMRNASESAAAMGLCPWLTPYQLWLLKTGRTEPAPTEAMQRGLALEPLARHAYEVETGNVMQPLVMQDELYSASLDGRTLTGELILEIKCPWKGQQSGLWQAVSVGKVPDHYRVQIQHQLMVCGAQQAHLWVFDGQTGLLAVLGREEDTMAKIRAAWEAFAEHLAKDLPPALSERDTRLRDDSAWLSAALSYQAAKREADLAAERLEQAKQALTALATHPRESGAGVAVTRYWKQGPIDYKRVPALQGLDLEGFRSKAREEIRVSVCS